MRSQVGGITLVMLLLIAPAASAGTRQFVDAAGRRVEVPERIERVLAAGPPAAVFVYTLARDRLLGWYRPLTLDERAYIPERYADLPTLGKLTGRSNNPNLEMVREARPDLILDYGPILDKDVALAERIQRETGIPYVLIDGRLGAIPRAYEQAGGLLGVPDRARDLARHARNVLTDVTERMARVAPDRRPTVYYARGAAGLETELIESLDLLRARNVADGSIERGPLVPVTLQQVRAWDPGVILAVDAAFAAGVRSDPAWRGIQAVREGRIHRVPMLPFAWLDLPPSVNRLIGLRWLGRTLYPELFTEDLRAEARAFYRVFYQHALDEAQLDALLDGAIARAGR